MPVMELRELLVQAVMAYVVHGTWTAVVVWLVWWPAWIVGVIGAGCALWLGEEVDATAVKVTDGM